MKTIKQFMMLLLVFMLAAAVQKVIAQAPTYPDCGTTPWAGIDNDCDNCPGALGNACYGEVPCISGGFYDCDDWDATAGCASFLNCDAPPYHKMYRDQDGDGVGGNWFAHSKTYPAGWVAQTGDCDDSNPSIHPGAAEDACDGVDNNCDGELDIIQYYADADGDGHGDPGSTPVAVGCGETPPAGSVPNNDDPDDGDSDNPPSTADNDGDGYSPASGDCNDNDAYVHPGAMEFCDGDDDNCNGIIDDGGLVFYYLDFDCDGDPANNTTPESRTCNEAPPSTDCFQPCTSADPSTCFQFDPDDSDPNVHGGAPEICDGVDNDADGGIDDDDPEGITGTTWYYDGDGDGYGAGAGQAVCIQPTGWVSSNNDPNDGDILIFPGAPEVCDGVDNNGNFLIDDADPGVLPSTQTTWYFDGDADGFGIGPVTTLACAQPVNYAAASGDCDDTDNTIYPGATETCNSIDDDCDGSIDEMSGLFAVTLTSTSERINWNAMPGANGYNIQYRKVLATSWTNKTINGGTNTFVNIAGLKKSITYEWKARARCSGNGNNAVYGVTSEIMTFTMPSARLAGESLTATGELPENIEVFPNPSSSQISISVGGYEGSAQLQVVNALGQQVINRIVEMNGDENHTLDISAFATGVYQIILSNDSGICMGKFVKE